MEYTKYVTKEGDRWDLIAHRAYGLATKFKIIMEANKTAPRSAVLPAGITLYIPIINEAKAKDSANLPPWKEHENIDNGLVDEPQEVEQPSRINENADPARYTVVNTLNQEQSSGRITLGTIGRIVAKDAVLTINGSNPTNIPSGTTLDIPSTGSPATYDVVNTLGNVQSSGSIPSGTHANIPAIDGKYILKNSVGTIQETGDVPSAEIVDVIADDGEVVIEYADGTPILTEPIPSGVSKIVSVPTPSGWYRPSEWIDVPTPQPNEAYFLFAVFENAPNQIAISIAVSGSGTSVVEIYDGVNPLPFNTYTSGYNNLSVNWSDCDPSTFIPELGYRQCIFKIKSIGGDLVSLNFGLAHATYGSGKVINILDYVNNIVTTGNTYFFSFGYTQQLPYMLEQARYLGSVGFSKQNWLYNCTSLKSLVLPNGVVSGTFRDAFSYCGLEYFPDNVIIRPSNTTYGSFYGSSFKRLVIDMTNETNVALSNHILSKVQDLELLNCGGITVSIGSLALPSLHRLILQNYRLSFTIANSLLFKEQAQLDLVNSLADLTGGAAQNITMTGLTQYPSVTALANSKNWNILI